MRLYERLGFRHVRDLDVWALDELVSQRHKLPPLALDAALGREERPPWQRADASVRNSGDAVAFGDDRGSLVYRLTGTVASILQCGACDADVARRLVTALPADVSAVRWLNGPKGHPLGEALASLGGAPVHGQHEMRLEL